MSGERVRRRLTEICDLRDGEYYANVRTWDVVEALGQSGIVCDVALYDGRHCDCRVSGIKS